MSHAKYIGKSSTGESKFYFEQKSPDKVAFSKYQQFHRKCDHFTYKRLDPRTVQEFCKSNNSACKFSTCPLRNNFYKGL